MEDRAAEIMRHSDVVAAGLHSRIQILAEGHTLIREEIKNFRSEVAGEFPELRSMVKFSYAELDRRIHTLEGAVEALTGRVDRLEAKSS